MIDAIKATLPDHPPIGLPVPEQMVEDLRVISAQIDVLTAQRAGMLQAIAAVNGIPWNTVTGWNLIEDFKTLTVTGPKPPPIESDPAAPESAPA